MVTTVDQRDESVKLVLSPHPPLGSCLSSRILLFYPSGYINDPSLDLILTSVQLALILLPLHQWDETAGQNRADECSARIQPHTPACTHSRPPVEVPLTLYMSPPNFACPVRGEGGVEATLEPQAIFSPASECVPFIPSFWSH